MQTVYHQFALLLAVAAIVGAIALRLRQPLLVAYIVVSRSRRIRDTSPSRCDPSVL